MTKDFDKLKLPPGLVESLKSRLALPHLHEFFKQFGRENEKLVTAMRDAEQQQLRRVPVPKRKRLTNKFVVLCDVLRTLFPPHGRVPASIGVRELHRMVTPQLWREAWLRLIKTSPPEVPGRGAVDAARRFLLNLPGATHATEEPSKAGPGEPQAAAETTTRSKTESQSAASPAASQDALDTA